MKSAFMTFGLWATSVVAQGSVPGCATECVQKFTSGNNIAGCKPLDIACVCKNQDFLNGIACCLEPVCDQAGKDAAVKYAQQICSAEGVVTPDQVVCKSGSASATVSGSAASASEVATTTAKDQSTSTGAGNTGSETDEPDVAAGLSAASSLFVAAMAILFAV